MSGGSWLRSGVPKVKSVGLGDLSAQRLRAGCVTVVALVRWSVWFGSGPAALVGPLHLAAPCGRKQGENSGRFAEEPSLP